MVGLQSDRFELYRDLLFAGCWALEVLQSRRKEIGSFLS
jgi:hypothetical protein